VRVPDSEGVANHAVPESCVRSCSEARHEALTGVRVAQPSSRESIYLQGADAVTLVEGNRDGRAFASVRLSLRGLRDPGMHVRSLHGNREISNLTVGASLGRRPASGKSVDDPRK
jgi:hypothetical protein